MTSNLHNSELVWASLYHVWYARGLTADHRPWVRSRVLQIQPRPSQQEGRVGNFQFRGGLLLRCWARRYVASQAEAAYAVPRLRIQRRSGVLPFFVSRGGCRVQLQGCGWDFVPPGGLQGHLPQRCLVSGGGWQRSDLHRFRARIASVLRDVGYPRRQRCWVPCRRW
jgi:hypothetical protein